MLLVTGCASSQSAAVQRRTADGHADAASVEAAHAQRAFSAGDEDRGQAHLAAAKAQVAAANALVEDERAKCAGVAAEAFDAFWLERGALREVTPTYERWSGRPPTNGRGYSPEHLVGADLTVFTDLEPSSLEAVLACHVARARSLGVTSGDPFVVRDASWKLRAVAPGLIRISVRVPDEAGAEKVLGRARAALDR